MTTAALLTVVGLAWAVGGSTALVAASSPCTINWLVVPADQNWANPNNWDSGRIPGRTDYACVPSAYIGPPVQVWSASATTYSVAGLDAEGTNGLQVGPICCGANLQLLSSSSTVLNFELDSYGTITPPADPTQSLMLTGSPMLRAGVIGGTGSITIPAGVSGQWVSATANWTSVHNLGHMTFTSSGTNRGPAVLCGGGMFINAGTVTLSATLGIAKTCPGSGSFINESGATLIDSGPLGTTSAIGTQFDNLGSVQVTAGELDINGANTSGQTDQGTYFAAAGTIFYFFKHGDQGHTLGTSGRLLGSGTYKSGGTLVLLGDPTVQHLQTFGTLQGNLTASKSLVITGNTLFSNVSSSLGGPSTTTVAAGATLKIKPGNSGTLMVGDGHTLLNGGTATWLSGNISLNTGSTGGTLENAGKFSIQHGNAQITGGLVRNDNGATILLTSPAAQSVRIDTLSNAGILDVREDPMTVGYSPGASSTTAITIGGTTAGTSYGQLTTFDVPLQGTLKLTTAPGYAPPLGESYQIMTGGIYSGTFSAVTGACIRSGVGFAASYPGNGVILTVQAEPNCP